MYYKTNVSALIADVTIKETKDGRIRATAIGRDPETETVYPNLGKVTSKVYSWSRRETAINEAIHKLETVYYQHYGNATATADDMAHAFAQVKDWVLNDGQRLSPRWKSASTNSIAIQYYERNVLPLLLPFADSSKRLYLASDRDAIEQTLIEATERRNGHDHAKALESVHTHLREADIIYQHMLDRNSNLPEIRLSSDAPFARSPKPEQIKYLPRHILLQFYKHLANTADEDPRFVFFAVSVVYGMRPAEAAARKPSDIYWAGTYCVAEVSSQERAGKLDPRLKNDYSRRPVIISYWGMRLLQRCCNLIGEEYPKDETAMNSSVPCAKRVKDLLIECGCSTALLNDLDESIPSDDLDSDDVRDKSNQLRSVKIGCYILRRVFATMMRSTMGLSMYVTDRMLGHAPISAGGKKTSKMQNADLNSPDVQRDIATKMERYVFDPEDTLNPAFYPYKASCSANLQLIEYSEYKIVNDTDSAVTLDLNLEAAETGERITIAMSHEAAPQLYSNSRPKDWTDHHRTVIGDTTKYGEEQK